MIDASRRIVLKAGIGLGLGWRLGSREAVGQDDRAAVRPEEGDLVVKSGDSSKTPLTPRDIPAGAAQTMAWAMEPANRIVRSGSRLNQLLLLRFDPEKLTPETRSRAAEGVVAYTSICTHTGCDVTNWHPERQLLECPCHYSFYDPKEGAKVVSGPSPRRLPALPLRIVEARIIVAKPFTGRAGFQQM